MFFLSLIKDSFASELFVSVPGKSGFHLKHMTDNSHFPVRGILYAECSPGE